MKIRKFYLQRETNPSLWDEVKIEMSPTLVNTLDETLDNLTLNLKINKVKKPYRPMLGFQLREYDDETETEEIISSFILSGDVVELVTVNPNRYKHKLTLVQSSEFLTKHEIRNTVFSTSLDGSQFVKTVARSVINKQRSDIAYGINDCETAGFENVSSSDATINVAEKKIKEMSAKISFSAQIPYFLNVKILRDEWDLYCNYKEMPKWSEIYNDSAYGSTLPTIVFTHGSSFIEWTILNDEIVNGQTVIVPENIITWIKQWTTGVITISIKNEGNTFIKESAFTDKGSIANSIPIFINFNVQFYINAIEMSTYDVVRTLLTQQMKHTKAYSDTVPLFNMPDQNHNSELYDLMINTSAPNFVFTQATFYEALAEIFKLWDAIFTIDNEGYLDIEYFNEHNPISEPEVVGFSLSHSEERFTNKLISYFQNTKIKDQFPNSNKQDATAYIRSKSLGVPSESDFVFVVPKPIDIINKVQAYANFSLKSKYVGSILAHFQAATQLVDITEFVVEEKIWTNLSNGSSLPVDGDWNKVGKINSLSYARGSNYIDVSGFFNTTTGIKQQVFNNVLQSAIHRLYGTVINETSYGDFYEIKSYQWDNHDIKLAVSYISLADGKIAIESLDKKYSGETLTNQSSGSIDINKLGLNMVGLSLKLGQPTLNMTQEFVKWEDRILKGQYFIDANNDKWVANNCVYTLIKNDLIQANIEFVKNFNSLATRIELNREKRLTNISNELTVKCEEIYGEYIYYSSSEIPIITSTEAIALNSYTVANQIAMGFGSLLEETYINDTQVPITEITASTWSQFSVNKKKLYHARGTIQSISNSSFTIQVDIAPGNSVSIDIDMSSIDRECIKKDYLTGELSFVADDSFENAGYSVGDTISVYILYFDEETKFGAINPNFNYMLVPTYYYQNTYKIEYALITALNEDNQVITNEGEEVKNIAVPMLVYGSGNSVCFEMSFDSPISAGNQLLDNYASGLWGMDGWFSKSVLYTDLNGKADKFTIDFVLLQEDTTRYFPEMKKASNNYLDMFNLGKIEELEYCKKPNEIFALNYQLYFLPIPSNINKDFLNNEFIKNNGFANGLNYEDLYIYYSENEDDIYSILDTKGKLSETVNIEPISNKVCRIISQAQGDGIYFRIWFITQITTYIWSRIKSWAICDKKGTIYFASNSNPSEVSYNEQGEFSINFISRHHRLD